MDQNVLPDGVPQITVGDGQHIPLGTALCRINVWCQQTKRADCEKVSSPAPTNPTAVTVVALDD